MSEREQDMITSPPHYTRGQIEVWDFIADQKLDYFTGNIVKYLLRAGHKGPKMEDLKKARAYLNKLIQMEAISESEATMEATAGATTRDFDVR